MILEDLIREILRLSPENEILDSSGPGSPEQWDSLAHATLMIALEPHYGVSLDIDEVMAIESVADIRRILAQKGAKGF